MRIKNYILVFLVCVLVTTTGQTCSCLGGTTSNVEEGEEITLTVWRTFDDEEVFQEAIDLYEELNPNINIEYIKKDYSEYEEETLDALAAGKGPDIWSIRNDWVYRHYDKLQPMTEGLLKKSESDNRTNVEIYGDTFADIASKDNIIDNVVYGIPYSIDTLALYYNKSHFTEAQSKFYTEGDTDNGDLFLYPPNNWENLLKISKILTQKNEKGEIIRSGSALGTAKNVSNSTDILSVLMLQNGTKMTSADNKTATFNLPITKESGEPSYVGTNALSFYTSFSNSEKENYSWNTNMKDSIKAFEEGKTSMMINYGYVRKTLAQEAPTLSYAVGPLPQISGASEAVDYASYWTETVTNNSEHPEEAWSFIKYIYDNGLDSYLDATKKPSPKRSNELLLPEVKERAIYGGDPFKFQIMTAGYWYKGTYPVKVDNAFYQMIQGVVISGESFQKAIDKAAATVTSLYK